LKSFWSQQGVTLAQKMQVGSCTPVIIQIEKAEVGPSFLAHLYGLQQAALDGEGGVGAAAALGVAMGGKVIQTPLGIFP
jgi:hypothetical protein